jgi:3',5'-cyclic-AMP phosphodiesterase
MKTDGIQILIKLKLAISISLLLVLISSCSKTFDYSVYSSYVPIAFRESRVESIELLEQNEQIIANNTPFKFALISDSHTSYNDLEDFTNAIKQKSDIQFILHGGDLTDGGMLAEYQLYHNIMNNSQKPYFPVIGNHDCLANGLSIYNDMFGDDDYTITFKNCKIIFFNDVVWELENREPDYFWLMDQLADTSGIDHVLVISHISPYSDSFTPLNSYAYLNILAKYKVDLSTHGHDHSYYNGSYNNDGIEYLIIGSVEEKHYVEITVDNDSLYINRIPF